MKKEKKQKEIKNKKKFNKTELEKAERKQKLRSILITLIINVIGSFIAVIIGLLWQDSFDLMAWANATLLAFLLVFFAGWIMFIHNKNIISMFTHSFKTFGLMLVGKKPAKTYYEVKTSIEENPIPNRYLIVSFVYSGFILIITIILTVLVM